MAETAQRDVVSFDTERLILVDALDRAIGYATKRACHEGQGIRHRAFSLFVFNARGEVLLQRRSGSKRLWPGYWSNSCCSHPRRGETMDEAIRRRLGEELGLSCPLRFLYKFEYRADFGSEGAEHEVCSVYGGTSSARVHPNANEIAASRWVAPEAFDREIAETPQHFTPWLRLEWARLRADFRELFAGPHAAAPVAAASSGTPPKR